MIYIGIDPGARGGIGIINGDTVQTVPYSNLALVEICQLYQDKCIAVIEKVHAMPGQGTVSMFSFGQNYGYILGVVDAYQIPNMLVDPRTWKHYFGITADKRSSIYKCQELYPGVNLLPTPRCKKESDGMAEALLIARWGLEHESQNT